MSSGNWLLSAYQADSHQAWCAWLLDNMPEQQWHLFSLPGRYFRWRIRGNPLSWLDVLPKAAPKKLLATSMVDLATLKGLHQQLNQTHCSLYFHENQFAYPISSAQHSSVDPLMVQLYAALAADKLAFNSHYNLASFLQGVEQLMAKMPDHVPAGISERLASKARVLPVPVRPVAKRAKKPLIVWPHRWEYDKAPERFAEILTLLSATQTEFQLALLGPRPKQVPAALADIRQRFARHIVADGRVSRCEYETLLGDARVVISTAKHEFQGLAVLEAVSAGAVPVVPNALCYVEQYAPAFRYQDNTQAVALITQALLGNLQAPSVALYLESALLNQWQDWLA